MSIASAPPRTEAIEWRKNTNPVPYDEAVSVMEARVREIRAGTAPELVWLLEHPALYTAGTSARVSDLVDTVDRKCTRLNSSHPSTSYAVICFKKKGMFNL